MNFKLLDAVSKEFFLIWFIDLDYYYFFTDLFALKKKRNKKTNKKKKSKCS